MGEPDPRHTLEGAVMTEETKVEYHYGAVPQFTADMGIEHSPDISKLGEAFAKVQGKVEGATKNSANPFFKSDYADLAAVYGVCRKELSEEKVAVFQFPSVEGRKVSVTTQVVHAGQWIRGVVSCMAKDDGPQAVGAAITYLRRYALLSIVGIETVDDDGEAAQDRTPMVASELNRQGKPLSLIPAVMEAMKGKTQKELPAVIRGMK
jgi:hypothetical protein